MDYLPGALEDCDKWNDVLLTELNVVNTRAVLLALSQVHLFDVDLKMAKIYTEVFTPMYGFNQD